MDEWKSALITLPENSFFELLRSIFGNIKTPFRKQVLMDDLTAFLSRDEIRKIISAYISEQDHKIISAVALLGEPEPKDLDTFFTGELTSAQLRANIINLEERLIIYRIKGKDGLHLALNPVLEETLTPFIADTGILFPSHKTKAAGAKAKGPAKSRAKSQAETQVRETVAFEDRIIAALFAFIQSEEEVFKPEGGVRKKVLDSAKKIFPSLDLELVIKTFLALGLLQTEGRSMVSNREKVNGYCELSAVERQEYWAAAVYLCLNESAASGGDIYSSRSSWSRLRGIASFIHRFRSLLDPDKEYPETTLRRLWELLGKKNRESGNRWTPLFFDSNNLYPFDPLIALMAQTGLLFAAKEACWKMPPSVPSSSPQPEAKPVIVMDAALSFVIYPEISFTDAMALGSFCSVKENDNGSLESQNTIRFEMSRQSVVRGYDQGIDAITIVSLLDRLSLNRLDGNLNWTLKDWESRYTGVSLHQGILLTLEEDRRYLADAGPVSRMIQKTLAPGVYLLSSEEKSEAIKILQRAGVDIVAQPPSDSQAVKYGFSRNVFASLGSDETRDLSLSPNKEPKAETKKSAPLDAKHLDAKSIKENFRKTLEKMKISKQERDELLARIERNLVLSNAQLDATALRYEKLEARGLDYVGKQAIAKQAVDTGSLLEISWPTLDGEINSMTGLAQALEKKEGDSILVLRTGGNSENGSKDFRIPLGKISLLRRIKQSIFGE